MSEKQTIHHELPGLNNEFNSIVSVHDRAREILGIYDPDRGIVSPEDSNIGKLLKRAGEKTGVAQNVESLKADYSTLTADFLAISGEDGELESMIKTHKKIADIENKTIRKETFRRHRQARKDLKARLDALQTKAASFDKKIKKLEKDLEKDADASEATAEISSAQETPEEDKTLPKEILNESEVEALEQTVSDLAPLREQLLTINDDPEAQRSDWINSFVDAIDNLVADINSFRSKSQTIDEISSQYKDLLDRNKNLRHGIDFYISPNDGEASAAPSGETPNPEPAPEAAPPAPEPPKTLPVAPITPAPAAAPPEPATPPPPAPAEPPAAEPAPEPAPEPEEEPKIVYERQQKTIAKKAEGKIEALKLDLAKKMNGLSEKDQDAARKEFFAARSAIENERDAAQQALEKAYTESNPKSGAEDGSADTELSTGEPVAFAGREFQRNHVYLYRSGNAAEPIKVTIKNLSDRGMLVVHDEERKNMISIPSDKIERLGDESQGESIYVESAPREEVTGPDPVDGSTSAKPARDVLAELRERQPAEYTYWQNEANWRNRRNAEGKLEKTPLKREMTVPFAYGNIDRATGEVTWDERIRGANNLVLRVEGLDEVLVSDPFDMKREGKREFRINYLPNDTYRNIEGYTVTVQMDYNPEGMTNSERFDKQRGRVTVNVEGPHKNEIWKLSSGSGEDAEDAGYGIPALSDALKDAQYEIKKHFESNKDSIVGGKEMKDRLTVGKTVYLDLYPGQRNDDFPEGTKRFVPVEFRKTVEGKIVVKRINAGESLWPKDEAIAKSLGLELLPKGLGASDDILIVDAKHIKDTLSDEEQSLAEDVAAPKRERRSSSAEAVKEDTEEAKELRKKLKDSLQSFRRSVASTSTIDELIKLINILGIDAAPGGDIPANTAETIRFLQKTFRSLRDVLKGNPKERNIQRKINDLSELKRGENGKTLDTKASTDDDIRVKQFALGTAVAAYTHVQNKWDEFFPDAGADDEKEEDDDLDIESETKAREAIKQVFDLYKTHIKEEKTFAALHGLTVAMFDTLPERARAAAGITGDPGGNFPGLRAALDTVDKEVGGLMRALESPGNKDKTYWEGMTNKRKGKRFDSDTQAIEAMASEAILAANQHIVDNWNEFEASIPKDKKDGTSREYNDGDAVEVGDHQLVVGKEYIFKSFTRIDDDSMDAGDTETHEQQFTFKGLRKNSKKRGREELVLTDNSDGSPKTKYISVRRIMVGEFMISEHSGDVPPSPDNPAQDIADIINGRSWDDLSDKEQAKLFDAINNQFKSFFVGKTSQEILDGLKEELAKTLSMSAEDLEELISDWGANVDLTALSTPAPAPPEPSTPEPTAPAPGEPSPTDPNENPEPTEEERERERQEQARIAALEANIAAARTRLVAAEIALEKAQSGLKAMLRMKKTESAEAQSEYQEALEAYVALETELVGDVVHKRALEITAYAKERIAAFAEHEDKGMLKKAKKGILGLNRILSLSLIKEAPADRSFIRNLPRNMARGASSVRGAVIAGLGFVGATTGPWALAARAGVSGVITGVATHEALKRDAINRAQDQELLKPLSADELKSLGSDEEVQKRFEAVILRAGFDMTDLDKGGLGKYLSRLTTELKRREDAREDDAETQDTSALIANIVKRESDAIKSVDKRKTLNIVGALAAGAATAATIGAMKHFDVAGTTVRYYSGKMEDFGIGAPPTYVIPVNPEAYTDTGVPVAEPTGDIPKPSIEYTDAIDIGHGVSQEYEQFIGTNSELMELFLEGKDSGLGDAASYDRLQALFDKHGGNVQAMMDDKSAYGRGENMWKLVADAHGKDIGLRKGGSVVFDESTGRLQFAGKDGTGSAEYDMTERRGGGASAPAETAGAADTAAGKASFDLGKTVGLEGTGADNVGRVLNGGGVAYFESGLKDADGLLHFDTKTPGFSDAWQAKSGEYFAQVGNYKVSGWDAVKGPDGNISFEKPASGELHWHMNTEPSDVRIPVHPDMVVTDGPLTYGAQGLTLDLGNGQFMKGMVSTGDTFVPIPAYFEHFATSPEGLTGASYDAAPAPSADAPASAEPAAEAPKASAPPPEAKAPVPDVAGQVSLSGEPLRTFGTLAENTFADVLNSARTGLTYQNEDLLPAIDSVKAYFDRPDIRIPQEIYDAAAGGNVDSPAFKAALVNHLRIEGAIDQKTTLLLQGLDVDTPASVAADGSAVLMRDGDDIRYIVAEEGQKFGVNASGQVTISRNGGTFNPFTIDRSTAADVTPDIGAS